VHYEVEESPDGTTRGVARLQMPEKLARNLVKEELPALDRPLRFVVTRGARGTVRGDTLHEVQELLARPWSSDEEPRESRRGGRDERGGRNDRGGRGGGRDDRGGRGGRPPWAPKGKKRR
jgi:uncharacterized membrane protein YgcG